MEVKHLWLGCDPEVFAVDTNVAYNGKPRVLPAYKWLPHKKNALKFTVLPGTYLSKHVGECFWDGVQAEFTTAPQMCIQYLIDEIRDALVLIQNTARKHTPTAQLTLRNVIDYPEDERASADEEHVALGCAPSTNVYGVCGYLPSSGREWDKRCVGFHIHAGDMDVIAQRERVVKALDAVLGVYSVAAAENIDEPLRRRYYGLAGEYRETKYGVEYRTLSNWMLCHPAMTNLVFEMTRSIITFALNSKWLDTEWKFDEAQVIGIINNCDVAAARALLARNYRALRTLLRETPAIRTNVRTIAAAMDVAFCGADAVIRDCFTDNRMQLSWGLQANADWNYHDAHTGTEPTWRNTMHQLEW